MRGRLGLVVALALPGAAGCRTLERFDTAPGESYCGSMVTAPFLHSGMVPDGRPPRLRARLSLDTGALESLPGTLSTDDTDGLCAPRRLFEAAPLRALGEVQHDQLYLLEFGEGRDQTILAWADSTCQGTLLAVISLMRNDSVELRLLKPAPLPAPDAPAAERPGFALFPLQRTRDCEF